MEEVMKALGLPGPYPPDTDVQVRIAAALRVQDAIGIATAIIAIGTSPDRTMYSDIFRRLVEKTVAAEEAPAEIAALLRLFTDARLASIESGLGL